MFAYCNNCPVFSNDPFGYFSLLGAVIGGTTAAFCNIMGGNRPDSEDFSLVELCGEVLMGFFSGGVENSIVGLGVNVFIAIYDFASAYEDAQINPNAWFGYGASVFISQLNLDVLALVFKTSFDDVAKAAFDYTFGVGLQMCDTAIGVIIETFTEKDNSITERMHEQSGNQPGETLRSSTTYGSSGGAYQVVSNNRFNCLM